MNNKLTLSINQSVIQHAKNYAKSSGKSLSKIVEEYLKSLAVQEESDEKRSSLTIVRELKGSVKMPDNFTSYEEILQDARLDKYLGK